ncbi:MAG: 16S rRNA (uracil(1498)-N(3))-methyltransferase [Bacteroidaceae bacterium]|nr:16S rRNA (uracil(1498)-N(3))-methyltransferase [Bacteroidaceae bacterium]
MKETRYFFCPQLGDGCQLPDDEAAHAVRVLRLREGDEILVTDGRGTLASACIAEATKRACRLRVLSHETPAPLWQGGIHIAVAPTKNADRMEWFVEKATEIGTDAFTFLHTANTERSRLNTERLARCAVSAMKQSHKAWLPRIGGPVAFTDFLETVAATPYKYICHCYAPTDFPEAPDKPLLLDVVPIGGDAVVIIGPEGDFTPAEVRQALAAGFRPVSLGESRLRTETAALAAVHMMYLRKRIAP